MLYSLRADQKYLGVRCTLFCTMQNARGAIPSAKEGRVKMKAISFPVNSGDIAFVFLEFFVFCVLSRGYAKVFFEDLAEICRIKEGKTLGNFADGQACGLKKVFRLP